MELQQVFDKHEGVIPSIERSIRRPSFAWADFWEAPVNDFAIRDEILYQFLPLAPDLRLLEVGAGSGFTAFRLARTVQSLALVDTADETLSELKYTFRNMPNVRCIRADLSEPGLAQRLGEQYDVVYALDVFEYVADPLAGFANFAAVLRPGGELFLSFPNVPPPAGDGVTYFDTVEQLDRMLRAAGFSRASISTVRLFPFATLVFRLLHEKPLRFYRRLRGGRRGERPQTFNRAWSFQKRHSLGRYRVVVYSLAFLLGKIMRLGGDLFQSELATNRNFRTQLVIRAWK